MQNYEDKHNFFISIIYFLPQFNTYTFIYIYRMLINFMAIHEI